MDTTAPLYLFCRQPNERYGDAFYSTEACTQVAEGDSSDVDASLKRPYRSLRERNEGGLDRQMPSKPKPEDVFPEDIQREHQSY